MKGRDLILGALIGAAAGVLLAPDSGVETRRKIKEESDRLAKKTKKKAKELSDTISARVENLKGKAIEKGEDLKSAAKSMHDIAHSAKSDTKQIKEELQTA